MFERIAVKVGQRVKLIANSHCKLAFAQKSYRTLELSCL
jgi:hypothetical protein